MIKDLILTDGSIEKVPAEFYQYLSQFKWQPLYWESGTVPGIILTPVQGHTRTGNLRNVIRNLIKLQQLNETLLAKILEEKTIRPTLFYPAAGPFWKPPE